MQLGHASKEDSDFENALLAYSRAEELLGEDADLWLSYGHLFKRMGRLGPALAAYERSAELAPGMLGGEALIQAEQIRGRFAWRIDASSQPETSAPLPALMDVVRTAEGEGRTLFRSYFRSFEMR